MLTSSLEPELTLGPRWRIVPRTSPLMLSTRGTEKNIIAKTSIFFLNTLHIKVCNIPISKYSEIQNYRYLLSPTKCRGREASSKWDHSSSSSTPPTLFIASRISPVLTCCSRHHLGPSSNCLSSGSVNCSEPMKSSEKRSLSQHSCREIKWKIWYSLVTVIVQ